MQGTPLFATHLLVLKEALAHHGSYTTAQFITQHVLGSDEYFVGTDNNPLTLQDIQSMEGKGEILALPEAQKIEESKTLWINGVGGIYYADQKNFDDKNREFLFTISKVVPEPKVKAA